MVVQMSSCGMDVLGHDSDLAVPKYFSVLVVQYVMS